jgi:hypothetical protein
MVAAAAISAPSVAPHAGEAWPASVQARYKLKYNGIGVGHIAFKSKTDSKTYALESNGEVSLLFGAIKWTGSSHVAGQIEPSGVAPKSYGFDWKKNSKGGVISMAFAGKKAVNVSVEPPSGAHPDTVPLTEQHKQDVVDPLSAIMTLTRADQADPCNRRVAVFDGKQRFNIVFSYKRKTLIPATHSGGASTVGVVCRAMYEPVAGYRADANAKSYAANRDAEVVMRPVPAANVLIPHSVTIPTSWGTGTMVLERVDVTSATAGQFALTE